MSRLVSIHEDLADAAAAADDDDGGVSGIGVTLLNPINYWWTECTFIRVT